MSDLTPDQPYRIKFRRDLDPLTGSPEATDALLVRANAAAGERIERVVIDEHQQGVVLAGWLLTFPEVLAAVLPDLLADAWDEGHADGLHDAHEYREHRKARNPYRPETITRDATGAPVALAGPDAINPPPDPSAAVTGPHNTERTTP